MQQRRDTVEYGIVKTEINLLYSLLITATERSTTKISIFKHTSLLSFTLFIPYSFSLKWSLKSAKRRRQGASSRRLCRGTSIYAVVVLVSFLLCPSAIFASTSEYKVPTTHTHADTKDATKCL